VYNLDDLNHSQFSKQDSIKNLAEINIVTPEEKVKPKDLEERVRKRVGKAFKA